MEMSWHPHERIVIVSIWSTTRCRASFRLPIDEAPAIIEMLATSFGDAAAEPKRTLSGDPMMAILERLRARRRQPGATIVSIDEHQGP